MTLTEDRQKQEREISEQVAQKSKSESNPKGAGRHEPADIRPVSVGGRGNEGGVAAATRELGLKRTSVQQAIKIAKISSAVAATVEHLLVFHCRRAPTGVAPCGDRPSRRRERRALWPSGRPERMLSCSCLRRLRAARAASVGLDAGSWRAVRRGQGLRAPLRNRPINATVAGFAIGHVDERAAVRLSANGRNQGSLDRERFWPGRFLADLNLWDRPSRLIYDRLKARNFCFSFRARAIAGRSPCRRSTATRPADVDVAEVPIELPAWFQCGFYTTTKPLL